MMLRVLTLVGVAVLVLNACSKNVTQLVAQCESDAYTKIGVQSDSIASIEYLANKHEFVRACLVKNGLRFKSDAWSHDYETIRQAYPDSVERHAHIAQLSPAYWE